MPSTSIVGRSVETETAIGFGLLDIFYVVRYLLYVFQCRVELARKSKTSEWADGMNAFETGSTRPHHTSVNTHASKEMNAANNNSNDNEEEEDDEDDYMSSAFLTSPTTTTQQPTTTYSQRRQRLLHLQHQRSIIAPLSVRQATTRDEGLRKPIDESNVGFKMMQKMGFKKGEALGRPGNEEEQREGASWFSSIPGNKGLGFPQDEQENEQQQKDEPPTPLQSEPIKDTHGRLLAPLPLTLLPKRQGLGLYSTTLKRSHAESAEKTSKRAKTEDEFKSGKKLQFEERRARGEVEAMRREVRSLDEMRGKGRSDYWPAEEEPDAQPGVETVLKKLDDSVAHEEQSSPSDDEQSPLPPQQPPFNALTPFQQRDLLIDHLRENYCFCHYCGVEFGDKGEMEGSCPGREGEDHG